MIKYRAFIKTAELGSITKAADVLGYSQPGLSHILKSFEEELGFSLLVKEKNKLHPTENGKKILDYCYRIVDIEDALLQAADSINGKVTGSITIGTPNSILVGFASKAISVFSTLYPDVEIIVQEDTLAETHANLHKGIIDIAFLTETTSGEFKFYPLFADDICLIMNEHHPLAAKETVPSSALKEYGLIMQIPGWDDISQIIVEQLDFTPRIKHYCASDAASYAMVENDLGVCIVSALQAKFLPAGVTIRGFEEKYNRTVLGIAVRSSLTFAQKEFIKIAQQVAESD